MQLAIDDALKKAVEAHKANSIQEADDHYNAALRALNNYPNDSHDMSCLASTAYNFEKYIPILEMALSYNPNVNHFWHLYLLVLIKLEQFSDAEHVFFQAKEKGIRGESLDQLEQVLIESITRHIYINTSTKNILDNYSLNKALKIADQNIKTGNILEAHKVYIDIIMKYPENRRAFEGLARMGISVKTEPQDPLPSELNFLSTLYRKKYFRETLLRANSLLKTYPNSPVLYNIIGAANVGLGELNVARGFYERAINIMPDFAPTYNNLGIALQKMGAIESAIKSYEKAIITRPDYYEAYFNLATAMMGKSDLHGAIKNYKRALDIKPDYFEAFYNLGYALKESGEMDAAIESFSQALKIKPDFADAHNNLGAILQAKGNPDAAIEHFKHALSINPNDPDFYNNMGTALGETGDIKNAVENYKRALNIDTNHVDSLFNIAYTLRGEVLLNYDLDIQNIIILILEKEASRPRDIAKAAISLIKLDPTIARLLKYNSRSEIFNLFDDICTKLVNSPLFLSIMKLCPITDLELENFLTDIRAVFLSKIVHGSVSSDFMKLQTALALQCYNNEYIYEQTDEEFESTRLVDKIVSGSLSEGKQPNSKYVLCLASYNCLSKCGWAEYLNNNKFIDEVYERQYFEPKEEEILKRNIKCLDNIIDEVSVNVRTQYEENPYPRWVKTLQSAKSKKLSEIVKSNKLKLFDNQIIDIQKPTILIAGCGTGQQSIGTALRLKESAILAVDLSMSSLAYAKRMTIKYAIKNVEYMQGDILNLGNLGRQFDIIECTGVLHHMENPMAGWKTLVDCLRPGGLIRIGLYSELARASIVTARKEIEIRGLKSNEESIKSFRREIINSNRKDHKELMSFSDFYSMSELRDLLFHVKEHRFSLPQIKVSLEKLGLNFSGFEAGKIVEKFERSFHDEDDKYDLDKWSNFEEANPNTFTGMYQFWCQKV